MVPTQICDNCLCEFETDDEEQLLCEDCKNNAEEEKDEDDFLSSHFDDI
jgi:uncharacterized Zn ribbon protein